MAAKASRFLIRGVIYEMRAFLQPISPGKRQNTGGGEFGRDWSNLVHANLNLSSSDPATQSVAAADVMARLGLKDLPGLDERVQDELKKKKLEEKQALEELIGTKDSIRAKYAERLRQKKVFADFKREQDQFNVEGDMNRVPNVSSSKHEVVTGSAALVRYLQERGVLQALLTYDNDEDLKYLLQELNNFEFQDVRSLEQGLSDDLLSSICSKWGLSPNHIMLVLSRNCDTQLVKSASDRGFFLCRVNQTLNDEAEKEKQPANGATTKGRKHGLFSWVKQRVRPSDGQKQHDQEQEQQQQQQRLLEADKQHNFNVSDMTELKWVIEDLNGVSYKISTLLTSRFK